jgi:hypothetical protein
LRDVSSQKLKNQEKKRRRRSVDEVIQEEQTQRTENPNVISGSVD